MGATTIWERWDSMLPDGTVNPGEMTSFNHYAFGAVADWLHRAVAGLAPAAPGYRRVAVRPRPGGGLTSRRRPRTTARTAASGWPGAAQPGRLRRRRRRCRPASPPLVQLPAASFTPVEVGSGEHHRFTCAFRAAADDPARRPAAIRPPAAT